MPKTILGKWSVGLMVAFILLFVLLQVLVASGQEGGETFFDNLPLSIPVILMAASGIAAFLVGLVSVVKNKERALTVFFGFFYWLVSFSFRLR